MLELLITLIMCHAIGDYVLQTDYLAMNKSKDWYILFIHSILYCVPFMLVFGWSYLLILLLISHVIIDAGKARYNKYNIVVDQILHYALLVLYFM